MTILAPGIYDIPEEQYHADCCPEPSLSASVANVLLGKSAAHARIAHPRLNPDYEPEHKAVFDLGSAAHHMVLRQDVWREAIEVVDAPDWRTKAAREKRDEAREAGLYPLLAAQYEQLSEMVGQLESHPQASRAFRDGKPERTLIWRDEQHGIWLRCKPDWMPDDREHGIWPDYKTTADANPDVWSKRFLLDHGGVLRVALYEEGIRVACGVEKPVQAFVVQENTPPFCIIVRVVPPGVLALGRAMLAHAKTVWARCLKADDWPGYELYGELELPKWAGDRLFDQYGEVA